MGFVTRPATLTFHIGMAGTVGVVQGVPQHFFQTKSVTTNATLLLAITIKKSVYIVLRTVESKT
jgi:hypothetical protein